MEGKKIGEVTVIPKMGRESSRDSFHPTFLDPQSHRIRKEIKVEMAPMFKVDTDGV